MRGGSPDLARVYAYATVVLERSQSVPLEVARSLTSTTCAMGRLTETNLATRCVIASRYFVARSLTSTASMRKGASAAPR